jgi:hypothetical protein
MGGVGRARRGHRRNRVTHPPPVARVRAGFDAKKFGGDTPYSIMFGPDKCGYSTKKSHVIFTWNGKNVLTKKSVKMEEDRLSHRYTLIVRPDNTYEVQIDGSKVDGGALEEDFDALPPKTIKDPSAKKVRPARGGGGVVVGHGALRHRGLRATPLRPRSSARSPPTGWTTPRSTTRRTRSRRATMTSPRRSRTRTPR